MAKSARPTSTVSKPATKQTGAQKRGSALPLPDPSKDEQQDLKELKEAEADLAADRKLKDSVDIARDKRNIRQLEKDILNDWRTGTPSAKKG